MKMFKRITALLLALVLVAAAVPQISVSAADRKQVSAASVFAGGSGTASDPYLVSNATQLLLVKSYPGKCFKQTTNISLGGDKVSKLLGSTFKGTYDGNGHTISNFTSSGSNCFVVNKLTAKAVIKNVTFKNVTLSGKYAAALVGENNGRLYKVKMVSCNVTTYLKDENVYSSAAGICNVNQASGSIRSCSVTSCKLTSKTDAWTGTANVAGICATNYGLIRSSKLARTTLTCTAVQFSAFIGGIAGYNKGVVVDCTAAITRATAKGDVNGNYGAKEYGEIGKVVHENDGYVIDCTGTGTCKGDVAPAQIYDNEDGVLYE